MLILIGSRALVLRGKHLCHREPVDFDWVCTQVDYESWMEKSAHKVSPTKIYELPQFNKQIVEGTTNLEFEIIKPGTSAQLLHDLVANDPETIESPFGLVPSESLLLAIKDSHKYKKFHMSAANFWKTAIDIHTLRFFGATIKSEHEAFCKLRQAETYTYAHPKLNVNKNDFFQNDGLQDVYVYDHDDIHKSVAIYDGIPAYTRYLKGGEQVQCSKKMFYEQPRKIQLAGIIEEAAVLAIERSKVPHGDMWSDEYAWKFAVAKVCSSLTSGWFRDEAFNSLPEILKMYPANYWEKFQADVKAGKIKPYNKQISQNV
jgi:hypothetical protein